ncbi:hypothetical protein GCM10011578_019300 [Streptomyces fuscichromogenes]|uniref:Uncharacterized protein n=1 Tax=Streptomyces fuscichromogenes TaxID=1324013 RepID=A0A917X9T5_9ACTN|nr:hypothetical protein GCM10011578_019300 [Streptomyces fuscichromogenes]
MLLSGSVRATAGKWRVVPLSQRDASPSAAGNWGGSTMAVIRSTWNPAAEARFAQFLSSDPADASMFATGQFFLSAPKCF